MCVSVCKCDECSFFNYCINMDFESVNKDLFIISYAFCFHDKLSRRNVKDVDNKNNWHLIPDMACNCNWELHISDFLLSCSIFPYLNKAFKILNNTSGTFRVHFVNKC